MPIATPLRSQVYKGDQLGRTIGFPTLNLDASLLSTELKSGVYAAKVWIDDREYVGALYFGPRLVVGQTKQVLEIYVLNFNREIYGKTVAFELGKFVRGVMPFDSLTALKQQMQADVEVIKKNAG